MIKITIRKKFWILLIAFLLGVLCGQCKADDIDINQIIKIESNGDPNAYNKKSGCIGLMQINPNGALADWNVKENKKMYELACAPDGQNPYRPECNQKYSIGDLYNPTINVKIGSWYINTKIPEYLKAYGIEDTVNARLACFNWGIGNYRKYLKGEIKMPKETKNYILKYNQ